jgi:hypothetical protein
MVRHLRLSVLVALVVALGISTGRVQGQSAPVADEFSSLHFRSIGPASMSGRITDFAVYEPNPAIYYVATAHGGVWKTTSGGAMYEPQLQNMGPMSIGDVTVSQKDPNLVWVGKGESNNRQSGSWGDGVFKSTDGGATWAYMGLRDSRHINRIVIDPDDNNIVFVAATGSLWGPGGDRGVYKTTDGGKTWRLVLKGANEFTGANDLVMAPGNRNILYASMYQRQRLQCCFAGGGPGSGIFKSTNGGETWEKLTPIPSGNMGRVALDVYRSSANLVYALIEAEPAAGAGGGAEAPAAGQGRGGRGGAAAGRSWRWRPRWPGRRRREPERPLSIRRRRRHVAARQPDEPAPDVLQPGADRSELAGPRLRRRCRPALHPGRRADAGHRRRARDSR